MRRLFAIYDSVITQNKTYRDAVLGRAQTLAWAGRLPEALAEYKRWVEDHPTDREASARVRPALSGTVSLKSRDYVHADCRNGDANASAGIGARHRVAW